MNRRDVFKLMGLASAATFMTRFPLLPKAEALSLREPLVHLGNFDVGLLREGTQEVRAHGYFRVRPGDVSLGDYGRVVRVKALFPTVTQGHWRTRGMGLYERDGGALLFFQHWDSGPIDLLPGNTIQVQGVFEAPARMSARAMLLMLGLVK